MNALEIESWLRDAHGKVVDLLKKGSDWWPTAAGHGQAESSAWATALFVVAARERCFAPELVAARNRGVDDLNAKVIEEFWVSGTARQHTQYEVLVDFAVHNWEASNPIQITGESEMHAQHGVGDTMDAHNDYSWDFYKLLVIPSITRLFMARVAARDGQSATERCGRLAQTLSNLVDWYGPALIRPHDELGAVIIPAAKREHSSTIIMYLDRGRLRYEKISKPVI
jgi:hypothetical protein